MMLHCVYKMGRMWLTDKWYHFAINLFSAFAIFLSDMTEFIRFSNFQQWISYMEFLGVMVLPLRLYILVGKYRNKIVHRFSIAWILGGKSLIFLVSEYFTDALYEYSIFFLLVIESWVHFYIPMTHSRLGAVFKFYNSHNIYINYFDFQMRS